MNVANKPMMLNNNLMTGGQSQRSNQNQEGNSEGIIEHRQPNVLLRAD